MVSQRWPGGLPRPAAELPVATECRHCGRAIQQRPGQAWWEDADGWSRCMRGVPHEPMPHLPKRHPFSAQLRHARTMAEVLSGACTVCGEPIEHPCHDTATTHTFRGDDPNGPCGSCGANLMAGAHW